MHPSPSLRVAPYVRRAFVLLRAAELPHCARRSIVGHTSVPYSTHAADVRHTAESVAALLHRLVPLFAANLQVDSGIFAGKSQVRSVHSTYASCRLGNVPGRLTCWYMEGNICSQTRELLKLMESLAGGATGAVSVCRPWNRS